MRDVKEMDILKEKKILHNPYCVIFSTMDSQ